MAGLAYSVEGVERLSPSMSPFSHSERGSANRICSAHVHVQGGPQEVRGPDGKQYASEGRQLKGPSGVDSHEQPQNWTQTSDSSQGGLGNMVSSPYSAPNHMWGTMQPSPQAKTPLTRALQPRARKVSKIGDTPSNHAMSGLHAVAVELQRPTGSETRGILSPLSIPVLADVPSEAPRVVYTKGCVLLSCSNQTTLIWSPAVGLASPEAP
ncbi:hypothetical protein NDU88_002221 [Pleurodeles waltl]|uniref:Uncharacterized protein n=1 Tax=Pleurodeles waltl TaxID=8319 RepID=A0AAV7PA71_PLEWA|nr:hypothetical protein NDU88_002221 [Pleurodeles waltl]